MTQLRRSFVALLVAGVLACSSGGAHAASDSVAGVFDDPVPYPGHAWVSNGQPQSSAVIVAAAGPDHCDWQKATLLTIGWPLGTAAPTAAQARQYLRDPANVTASGSLRSTLVLHATLPVDAKATGYRVDGVELYLAPSDEDVAAYLVARADVERWPRSDPMTVCS